MNTDILQEHPVNSVINEKTSSSTKKKWTEKFNAIKNHQLKVRVEFNDDYSITPDWSQFVAPCGDDLLRRQNASVRPNMRSPWVLGNEDEGCDYFQTEVVSPVMAALTDIPAVCNRRTYSRSGVIVDTVFQFHGQNRDIVIGEYKRNLFDAHAWMGKTIDKSPDQVRLSRELRGYAVEYECPHIFCFDIQTLVLLQFRAKSREDLNTCDVDCWIFPRLEIDRAGQGYPLRDALYRFLVQGLRRKQCEGYPLPTLGGLKAYKRAFFSGEPLWKHANQVTRHHPEGYVRDTGENGRLYWKLNGEWVVDSSGQPVADSYNLWMSAPAASDAMEDIYSAA